MLFDIDSANWRKSKVSFHNGGIVMPIYEYDCCRCEISFSVLQTSKTSSVKCPNCSSEEIKKRISMCSSFAPTCSINKTGGSGGS